MSAFLVTYHKLSAIKLKEYLERAPFFDGK